MEYDQMVPKKIKNKMKQCDGSGINLARFDDDV
jgi:hypothetical protein